MAYSRTFYGTGDYIYHQFVRGANLSRPIKSWDDQTPPARTLSWNRRASILRDQGISMVEYVEQLRSAKRKATPDNPTPPLGAHSLSTEYRPKDRQFDSHFMRQSI